MAKKKAFITGITGQDGSYMVDLLLAKGYEVHGLVRRSSSFNRWRIEHVFKDAQHPESKITMHYGDLTDASSLARLIEKLNPDEIYNLGAQSHVGISFDTPEYTINTVALGTLRLLEAIREARFKTKFYQASSSEMFGIPRDIPQNEKTSFYPRSPYAIAKVAAHWTAVNYREAYGIPVSCGILFNHESPRRGENFVTRKVAMGVAEILAGKRDKIYLGNLDSKRDWGYAPEYVQAMWKMLQQDKPDDYIIATGENHTVKELVQEALKMGGIKDWKKYVAQDPRYYRPTEADHLLGDFSKARAKLGWEPKTKFKDLVRLMVKAECDKLGVKLPEAT